MNNSKKLRAAVVGCGTISSNHIAAIIESDKAVTVALCDTNRSKAEARAEQYGLNAKIYESYDELIEKEELDVVHIATPHYLHVPMAIKALKKNINVFLEKPMAISCEEIEALLNAEKASKAKLTVCFQNRFNSTTIIAKQIADEDGGAIECYASLFWQRNEKYYTESGWRGKYSTEGGGVMINQAIHTIDLLCFFLGIPQKVSATIANHHLKGVIEVEDSCGGRISFNDGKIANFYATNACINFDVNTVFIKTKNHKIEIISSSRLYVDGKEIDIEHHQSYVGKQCYGVGHFKLISEFYDSIINDTAVPVTADSAQYALRILLAAYKSNGEEISV